MLFVLFPLVLALISYELEYNIIHYYFKKYYPKAKFSTIIFFITIFTIIPTQVGNLIIISWYHLNFVFYIVFSLLFEIALILIDVFILILYFNQFNKIRKDIVKKLDKLPQDQIKREPILILSNKKIAMNVFIANIISYMIGLLYLYGIFSGIFLEGTLAVQMHVVNVIIIIIIIIFHIIKTMIKWHNIGK
ncbi:MAG: hypothetical protein JXA99_09470 [Candidatus Lokiarchaeota archaeon]|nr:hypothetical protein [Candidatus Lokiarchaeota archaeon]